MTKKTKQVPQTFDGMVSAHKDPDGTAYKITLSADVICTYEDELYELERVFAGFIRDQMFLSHKLTVKKVK